MLKDLNVVYDVYLCSACVNPFIIQDSGRLFMDIFTNTKNMIEADIQIDDRLNNLLGRSRNEDSIYFLS